MSAAPIIPTSGPLATVLALLKGVKKVSGGFQATCPAHEDQRVLLAAAGEAPFTLAQLRLVENILTEGTLRIPRFVTLQPLTHELIREGVLTKRVAAGFTRLDSAWALECQPDFRAWGRFTVSPGVVAFVLAHPNRARPRPLPPVVRRGQGMPRLLRERVLERDGYRCARCGATANLQVDHIQPRSRGGDNSLDNLRTLCLRCNASKGARLEPVGPSDG